MPVPPRIPRSSSEQPAAAPPKKPSTLSRAVKFSLAGAGLLGIGTYAQLHGTALADGWKLGICVAAAAIGGVGGLLAGLQAPRG